MVSSVGKRGPNLNFRGWGKDRDRFLKNFRDFLGTGMTLISGFLWTGMTSILGCFFVFYPRKYFGDFFGTGMNSILGFYPQNPPNFWGIFTSPESTNDLDETFMVVD